MCCALAAWVALGAVRPAEPPTQQVVVADADLAAGTPLHEAALRVIEVPVHVVPSSALPPQADLDNRYLAGAIGAGEIVSSTRLRSLAPPEETMSAVFIPVEEPTLISALTPGTQVDLIDPWERDVLAEKVAVAAAVAGAEGTAPGVFVTVPTPQAPAVAAAAHALGGGVAVVIRSE